MGVGKEVLNLGTSFAENTVMTANTFLELIEKWLEEMRENKCAKVLAEHIANGKDIDFRLASVMCYENIHNALLNPSQYLSPEVLKREYGDNYKDKEVGGRLPPIPFMIYTDPQTNQLMVITREEDRAIVDEIMKDSTKVTTRVSENKLNMLNKNGKVLEISNLSAKEHRAFTVAAKKLGLTYSELRNPDDNETFSIKFSATTKKDIAKANLCINKSIIDTMGFSAPKYIDFHTEERVKSLMNSVINAKEDFCVATATSPNDYIKVEKEGIYYTHNGKEKYIKRSDNQFNSVLISKIKSLNVPVICTNEEFKKWDSKELFQKVFTSDSKLTAEQERIAELEEYVKTLYDFKSSFDAYSLSQNIDKLKDGTMSLEQYLDCSDFITENTSDEEICKIVNECFYFVQNEMSETDKDIMKEYIISIDEKINDIKNRSLVYQIDEQDIKKTLKDILTEMDIKERQKSAPAQTRELENNVNKNEDKE